jgi:hypothetical protein
LWGATIDERKAGASVGAVVSGVGLLSIFGKLNIQLVYPAYGLLGVIPLGLLALAVAGCGVAGIYLAEKWGKAKAPRVIVPRLA